MPPALRRRWTMASWPRADATASAVVPSGHTTNFPRALSAPTLTSASLSRRSSTTRSCPVCEAIISGVKPQLSSTFSSRRALTWAPAAISSLQTSMCPSQAAM
eukprot:3830802-Rhodomonas_salina.1